MVKGKKTVHIEKDIHKALELYKTEKELSSLREAIQEILLAGFEAKKEEIPDYINAKLPTGREVELPEDKDTEREGISINDLGSATVDLSEDLEGKDLASDQSMREITLGCLRYLKNHKEVTHHDFKEEVYPDFEDQFKEDSFWKIAKSGLKQVEELGGPVKTPKGRGHSKYIWKV